MAATSLILFISLSESQRALYNDYLNDVYRNARGQESGVSISTAELPNGIPNELSSSSLLRTDELLEGIKSGTVNLQEVELFLNGAR